MKKIELNTNVDVNEIKKFVSDIQKEFKDYDINESNVIDFSLLLDSNNRCKKCKGIEFCENENPGYKLIYEDNNFKYAPCKYQIEKQRKNRNKSLIKTLYLPNKILEAKIEDYETNSESRKKVFQKINEFISATRNNEFSKGLLLWGSFSIGKTYTLACIANELARNNIESLLIYFPDLVTDLKNAMNDNSRYEALINMLKSIPVLMLDDFGSENMTPWIRDDILGPVINYRVLENKPLFISTNLKPSEIKTHLAIDKSSEGNLKADRIISRLNSLMSVVDMNDSNRYNR